MARSDVYCDICLRYSLNTQLFGEFIHKKDLDVHYYCLLSSENTPQRGKDNQGIFGFLLDDIKESIPKFHNNVCYICNGKRAAVRCAENGCDRTFHYTCGRIYGCITQFTDSFNSYCNRHVPRTNVLTHEGTFCNICYLYMADNHPATTIFSACCKEIPKYQPQYTLDYIRDTCFTHADCIQRYVVNAGYDSRCINCDMESMSKEEWQNQMRMKGIFVPQRMAEWENDDYFKDQTKNKCVSQNCKTPNETKNVWTCFACGCIPLHLKCARVNSHEEYICAKCIDQTFVKLLPIPSTSSIK